MNNLELIDYVFKNSDVQKKDIKVVFEKMVKGIHATVRAGGSVSLSGVGIFDVQKKRGRVGRHPKTQVPIIIPAKKVVKIKMADAMNSAARGL